MRQSGGCRGGCDGGVGGGGGVMQKLILRTERHLKEIYSIFFTSPDSSLRNFYGLIDTLPLQNNNVGGQLQLCTHL